jgi:hypothetical protein
MKFKEFMAAEVSLPSFEGKPRVKTRDETEALMQRARQNWSGMGAFNVLGKPNPADKNLMAIFPNGPKVVVGDRASMPYHAAALEKFEIAPMFPSTSARAGVSTHNGMIHGWVSPKQVLVANTTDEQLPFRSIAAITRELIKNGFLSDQGWWRFNNPIDGVQLISVNDVLSGTGGEFADPNQGAQRTDREREAEALTAGLNRDTAETSPTPYRSKGQRHGYALAARQSGIQPYGDMWRGTSESVRRQK